MRYTVTLMLVLGYLILKRTYATHTRTQNHTYTGAIHLFGQSSIIVCLKGSYISQHRKTIQLTLFLYIKPYVRVKILHLTRKMCTMKRSVK